MNANEISTIEQEALQQKVEKFAGEIQLVIPTTAQETWDEVVRLEEQAFVNAAKRGMLLLTLKGNVEHGFFYKELEARGIGERSARNAMTVAKMLIALPDSKRQTSAVLNMNQSQLVEFAKLPLKTIESLDDEDLESLSDLSVRELKKEIQRLKADNKELDFERGNAINELGQERMRKQPNVRFDMPVFISQCRSDAIAHTELLDDALMQSIAQTTELCEKRSLDFDSRLAAAQTMHHCWASVYMQVGQMLERLHGEFGDRIQGIENLPRFTEAEWEYVDSERSRMLESFQAFINSKRESK